MKKSLSKFRSNPALFYLVVFLIMIVPGTLGFLAAKVDNQDALGVCVFLVVLGNLITVIF